MDIHIDADQLKMFVAIVIAGAVYGQYLYRKGLRHGWDNLAYLLDDESIIRVGQDGEIKRVSDREYNKYKQSEIQYNED